MSENSRIIINEERIYDLNPVPVYEGQYSTLYQAIDRKLKRKAAVKIVKGIKDFKQLMREVTVCCRLSDSISQIPMILDYKTEKDTLYIVMQWIPGEDLTKVMEKPLSYYRKMKYAQDLCSVLKVLHKNRYEHRDLKPDNIRISNDDRVYLIDFNLSTVEKHRGTGSDNYRPPENDINYSIKGVGTGDVFSLGVILYQLFTGHLPMPFVDYAADYDDKEWAVFNEPKKYMPQIDSKLNNIITRCMKMDPKDRYQNAEQICYELSIVANRRNKG